MRDRNASSNSFEASSNGHAGKMTICHSTNSATNPYVENTPSVNAVQAHDRHHDGHDIIPAPGGGCPDGATQAAGNAVGDLGDPPSGILSATGLANAPESVPAEPPASGVLGVADDRGALPGAEGGVMGANQGGGQDDARETTGSALPYTGLGLGILAALGALLAGTGALGRRRTA